MSDQPTEQEIILKLMEEAVAKIREHCDCVHIFANRHMDDGTSDTEAWNLGAGNWYARKSHVETWLRMQDERERIMVRRDEERDRD